MSNPSKAIFLSYASQDAEAARRLCESLRHGGIEVWFDSDGGLEHGDEWDQKIRRQIKECLLFIAVISANTQARQEGYFRLEWELAAQRALSIASGVAFILPIVIDETREPDALVPDRFRAVQWMRLPGGAASPEVLQRFLKLWSHRAGVVKNNLNPAPLTPPANDSPSTLLPTPAQGKSRRMKIGAATLILAGIILGGWQLWRPTERPRLSIDSTRPIAARPLSEGAQLAERAKAIYEKPGFTASDLGPAEELARRATERETDNATTWGVSAGVQASWLNRTWDLSEKRRGEVQTRANRALALDPNEPEALLALAFLLIAQNAPAAAVDHLRRAIAANPQHVRLARAMGRNLIRIQRVDEGRQLLLNLTQRAPRDPLIYYELALSYTAGNMGFKDENSLAQAIKHLDAALQIYPLASALNLKAYALANGRGDLPAARLVINQLAELPLADRAEDRSVATAMWIGLLEHQPHRVESAAALTTRSYFTDSSIALAPMAWSLALAHRLAGKDNRAHADWQSAETVLRQLLKEDPANKVHQVELAATLAWLDQNDQAEQLVALVEPLWKEDLSGRRILLLALYYAARGDVTKATPYLTLALNGNSRSITTHTLRLHPWWDKLRRQPEFEKLLSAPTPTP